MKTIYVALENADLNEGRGPMIERGYFTKREDAVLFAEKVCKGVQLIGYGEVKEITVCDNLSEHGEWRKNDARESALKKLTAKEREALGV